MNDLRLIWPVLGVWCWVYGVRFILSIGIRCQWIEIGIQVKRSKVIPVQQSDRKGSESTFVPVVASHYIFLFLFSIHWHCVERWCSLLSGSYVRRFMWEIRVIGNFGFYFFISSHLLPRSLSPTLWSFVAHFFMFHVSYILFCCSASVSIYRLIFMYFNFQSNWQWHPMSTRSSFQCIFHAHSFFMIIFNCFDIFTVFGFFFHSVCFCAAFFYYISSNTSAAVELPKYL